MYFILLKKQTDQPKNYKQNNPQKTQNLKSYLFSLLVLTPSQPDSIHLNFFFFGGEARGAEGNQQELRNLYFLTKQKDGKNSLEVNGTFRICTS